MRTKKVLAGLVLASVAMLAFTGVAHADVKPTKPMTTAFHYQQNQLIRIVNHAGLSGDTIRKFTNAGRYMVNKTYGVSYYYGPNWLHWTSSHNAWTLELVNSLGPVERMCGWGAAGCHLVHNGRPYAIADVNSRDTRFPWSGAPSHELFEMWADARLHHLDNQFLVEIADPVEDWTQWVKGVQMSDWVNPSWYENEDYMQDAFDKLDFMPGYWHFSCPTGYAGWRNGQGWNPMGCSYSEHTAASTKVAHFRKAQSGPVQATGDIYTNRYGEQVSRFDIPGKDDDS